MKKFFLSIIIFLGILCWGSVVVTSNFHDDLKFEFNGVSYNLELEELENDSAINLTDYPYYFVGNMEEGEASELALFYSKERISLEKKQTDEIETEAHYCVRGGEETLKIRIKADGSIQEKEIIDLKNSDIVMTKKGFVIANQNIYDEDKAFIFRKNCGYEYDESKEKKEECDEKVKIKVGTVIYEKPVVNYDEIGTVSVDNVVKRIKKEVNEVDGKIWDKVQLGNGEEGYVLVDNLETIEDEKDVKEVEFLCGDERYKVYLSSLNLEVNFDDYENYLIAKKDVSRFVFYYSKEKISLEEKESAGDDKTIYNVYGGEESLQITIDSNGLVQGKKVIDLKNSAIKMQKSDFVIASQEIFEGAEEKVVVEEEEIQEAEEYADEGVIMNASEMDTNNLEMAENGVKRLEFPYNGVVYTVELVADELGVDLSEYEYYFVKKINETELALYYSNERIRASYAGGYEIRGGEKTILVTIGVNGTIQKSVIDLNRYYVSMSQGNYVASNQNIYYGETIIFVSNTGENGEKIKVVKAYCKYNNVNNFNGNIDSMYGEDILLAVKEFQGINGLTQTGYIDIETFEAMGLTDSNTYNTYLKIANNYRQYKNPYGPTPYNVPESNSGMKFELGRKKAQYSSEQQEYYNRQDSKYNSMTIEERIIKDEQMAIAENSLKILATLAYVPYPHASDGIIHYLSKEGGTHYINNVEELFHVGNSDTERSLYLEYTKEAIEYMLTIEKATDFSMVNSLNITLPVSDLDWFGMYGRYFFSVEGSCYKKGDLYFANGYCYARDYYDFDKVDELDYIFDAILDRIVNEGENIDKTDFATTIFADLHYAGKAKFYYIEGHDDGFLLTWASDTNKEEKNNEK